MDWGIEADSSFGAPELVVLGTGNSCLVDFQKSTNCLEAFLPWMGTYVRSSPPP